MVVKFGQNQSNGAAGENAMSPKRGYNFANLYQANRADDQMKNKANSLQQKYNSIGQQADDGLTMANKSTNGAPQPQNPMASAVQRAKSMANDTQNFSPTTQARKNGASAYQAGVAGFYAGGQNSQSAKRIRKFSNIYQNTLDKQSQYDRTMADKAAKPDSAIGLPGKPVTPLAQVHENDTQKLNSDKIGRSSGDDTKQLSNLMWMLKTGRITNDQYNQAMNDDKKYKQLSDKYN